MSLPDFRLCVSSSAVIVWLISGFVLIGFFPSILDMQYHFHYFFKHSIFSALALSSLTISKFSHPLLSCPWLSSFLLNLTILSLLLYVRFIAFFVSSNRMKKDAYFLSPWRQSESRICSSFFLWRFSISVRLLDFLAYLYVNWVSWSFTRAILWFFPKSWVIFAGFIFFACFSFN